jgi:DNA gyrase/topoisomerase IV subunit A
MDSLQARALSGMRFYELSTDAYQECLKRAEELLVEIKAIEDILNTENGIDKLITAELREGMKLFGNPRKSNVVPYKISVDTEVEGVCILQLSSDGMLTRRIATNVDEEPLPVDSNGFAVKVENDCSFVVVDDEGYFAFVKVRELPVDQEVPLNRYIKQPLKNIVGLLPYDIESHRCAIIISKFGVMKKVKIAEMRPSKRPCIEMAKQDRIVRAIGVGAMTDKDILIYTKEGFGQRLDPNEVRMTSFIAKGGSGFKLQAADEIIGCYSIVPTNQYLLYVTTRGKMRLNLAQYLPLRDSKHESMVRLINLPDRDRLLAIVGCNKFDRLSVFYDDGDTEIIDISKLEEGTMSGEPKKTTKKNAVSTNIVKVKLL